MGELEREGGGGGYFLTHYFCECPSWSYITRIISVVGAQQQRRHVFKTWRGGGGGAKISLQCHIGGGGGFFFRVFSKRRGGVLVFPPTILPNQPPAPLAINNELSLNTDSRTYMFSVCVRCTLGNQNGFSPFSSICHKHTRGFSWN